MYYETELVDEKLTEEFLNIIISLHKNRKSDEVIKLLNIVTHKERKEIDIKYVSVKSNDEIKKVISSIKCVIPESTVTLWIENILVDWIDKLNKYKIRSNIDLFVEYPENGSKMNRVINFNVDKYLWGLFIFECKRLDLTISNGFRCALLNYIDNNIKKK